MIGIKEESELSSADFVNHSCNPNCGIKEQISLIAFRNIEFGEEITFDYGTILYSDSGDAPYELECTCGHKNCRKKISDSD